MKVNIKNPEWIERMQELKKAIKDGCKIYKEIRPKTYQIYKLLSEGKNVAEVMKITGVSKTTAYRHMQTIDKIRWIG